MVRSLRAVPRFSSIRLTDRVRGRACARPKQSGYSLYDLMVTLSVAGVVSTGAVSAQQFIEEGRMRARVDQLRGDLMLARSEAVKRGASVTICKSPDGFGCDDRSPWQHGWMMFADTNANHARESDETVLRVQQALDGGTALRYGKTTDYDYVTYYPTAYASPATTFTFCDRRGATKAKAIIINWTGRARVSTKTSDGEPLSCSG